MIVEHGRVRAEPLRDLQRGPDVEPAEPPARIPSSRASRRAVRNESRSETRTHSSTTSRSIVSGHVSLPIPSTRYGCSCESSVAV